MGGARLEPVLTIAEVARRAGWCCEDRKDDAKSCDGCSTCENGELRMRRHLITQDKQLGGMLLTKTGTGRHTRYLVTLGAIEQIHPEWFVNADKVRTRIEVLEEAVADLTKMVESAHVDIGILRRAIGRVPGVRMPT